MTLRRKLLILVYVPALTCTVISVSIASFKIRSQGTSQLEEKSAAILALNIQEYLTHHQDGTSVLEQEGHEDAMVRSETDQAYEFRISSLEPENPKHTALQKDKTFFEQFEKDKSKQISFVDKETDSLMVIRPVFMEKSKGCLECHAVSKSGRRVDENELRGIFVVTTGMGKTNDQVRAAILQMGAVGLIIIVIAIFVGILVVVKILAALKQINGVSKRVAGGDLQQRVNINSNDELEELGSYINKMIESLNKVLSGVRSAAKDLTLSTSEITETSEEIASGAQNQAHHFEQINHSFQLVAENAAKASDFVNQSVSHARVAESGMNKTIDWMENLKGSSVKISEAVKVINSISFQTNILALNAAVEAAHAGLQGRGFSVIASEVKKLSDITTTSSGEINEVTTSNLTQVETGVNIARDAGVKIVEIMKSVSQISSMLKEISQTLKEQSLHLESNLEVTRINSQASEKLNTSAVSLHDQASHLLEIVNYFKLAE